MPIEWLVDYWNRAAEATLPFLKNRKVAVQQVFGGKTIYRRHGDKGLPDSSGWIQIKNAVQIKKWAQLHTYSFHAHLKGDKDTWFVMDVDGRTAEMFALVKLVALEMSKLLSRKNKKHLVKFSGSRGFHFMWSMGRVSPNWLSLRKEIRGYVTELEGILQKKYKTKFYAKLPKAKPILATSSTDRSLVRSILIDEQIVHKNGMIRSPYSVHPKTGLVSVPLKPSMILKFKPEYAKPKKVKIKKVLLPVNQP